MRRAKGGREERQKRDEQNYESEVHQWHGAASVMVHPSHHTHSSLTRSQSTIVLNWILLISWPLPIL